MRRLIIGCMAVAFSSMPAAAFAARAYTINGAQIFSGPGENYPVVAQLGNGVAVNVNGCLSDYSWCDINLGPNRGWVYAQDLAYPYRNRRVLIPEYGPQLGLPLITFSLGNYWDRYYRGRSFYGERAQWDQRWREHERARAENRGEDHDRDWHARNAQREHLQQDRHRDDSRARDRGSLPDLPGGGPQGLPPGDHSRYQQ